MKTSFQVGFHSTLHVGNNISEPNSVMANGYIGMYLEIADPPMPLPDGTMQPASTRYVTVAHLKPHEARAMASVLLAAATEGKG